MPLHDHSAEFAKSLALQPLVNKLNCERFENLGGMAELPRYRCHKEVHALKIKAIEYAQKPTIAEIQRMIESEGNGKELEILPNGELTSRHVAATFTPEDSTFGPFSVTADYIMRHKPEVGGYYVVYTDGYKSYSPAKAFEEGYTKI